MYIGNNQSTWCLADVALACAKQAIELFERDLAKVRSKNDSTGFMEESWRRSGARMYYLAGGILHGLNRHSEATPYFESALKYSKGWRWLFGVC